MDTTYSQWDHSSWQSFNNNGSCLPTKWLKSHVLCATARKLCFMTTMRVSCYNVMMSVKEVTVLWHTWHRGDVNAVGISKHLRAFSCIHCKHANLCLPCLSHNSEKENYIISTGGIWIMPIIYLMRFLREAVCLLPVPGCIYSASSSDSAAQEVVVLLISPVLLPTSSMTSDWFHFWFNQCPSSYK